MKYFFLSNGWNIGRVWEFGGLWNENSRGRGPIIKRLNLGIVESSEVLWLYQVEDDVLMVEVKPISNDSSNSSIGQVVLKRLISAEDAMDVLASAEGVVNQSLNSSINPSINPSTNQ